jgi:hypothetical protein
MPGPPPQAATTTPAAVCSPPPPPPSLFAAPFANDPVRTTSTLPVNATHIGALDGPNFLSTALIDYVLQQALKDSIAPDVLIGSSNSMSFFDMANRKTKKEQDGAFPHQRSVDRMRESYLPYSNGRFRFLSATCTQAHFFVVDVTYDFHNPNIFENVIVYDSLRKTSRRAEKDRALNPRTKAAQFLRNFQIFLAQYCLFQDTERSLLLLEEKPDLLVDACTVAPCPQQQNGHDCGLFAFAILVHLAYGIEITEGIFTQNEISRFRKHIHEYLSRKEEEPQPSGVCITEFKVSSPKPPKVISHNLIPEVLILTAQ